MLLVTCVGAIYISVKSPYTDILVHCTHITVFCNTQFDKTLFVLVMY